jgi:peptidoglycan/xylan/chitin deacetylase (PgdA/CDA1 family)
MPLSPPFPLVKLADRLLNGVVFFGKTKRNVVSLTLDDGPHPTVTPAILDLLGGHGARATFFLLGSSAQNATDVVQRIADEKHELGNHSWKDEFSALVPRKELAARVARTHDVLSSFGEVQLFRPGKGWPSGKVRSVAEEHKYRCVLGSIYPHDVRVKSDRRIIEDVLGHIRPGAIIILHEGTAERARVVSILEAVLDELKRRDYEVTTVSDLLRLPD